VTDGRALVERRWVVFAVRAAVALRFASLLLLR